MRIVYAGAFVLLLLLVSISSAAITNGGFETGTLAGWTMVENGGSCDGNDPATHSGSYAASCWNGATISQSVSLTGVDSITFWSGLNGGTTTAFRIDGVTITGLGAGVYPAYVEHTVDVSGYSGMHTITFDSGNGQFFLDDVGLIITGMPITQPASGVTSKCINFSATNSTGDTWWEYGTVSGRYGWKTENVTAVAGIANSTECGTPLMSNTKFYFRACDEDGCGIERSTTLAVVTPAPTTTFGKPARNISVAHFDFTIMGGAVTEPYTWAAANADIVFGVLLFFVFTGLWLRQREVILPILLGLIGSGLLIYAGATSVGIPPEMLIVVVGLVSAGLAGVVTGMLKR